MLLYHVTPAVNVPKIRLQGVLIAASQGKHRCVWAASARALWWAIPHVADHHAVPEDHLSIILFRSNVKNLVRTGRPGVVCIRQDVAPSSIDCVLSVSQVDLLHQLAAALAGKFRPRSGR